MINCSISDKLAFEDTPFPIFTIIQFWNVAFARICNITNIPISLKLWRQQWHLFMQFSSPISFVCLRIFYSSHHKSWLWWNTVVISRGNRTDWALSSHSEACGNYVTTVTFSITWSQKPRSSLSVVFILGCQCVSLSKLSLCLQIYTICGLEPPQALI